MNQLQTELKYSKRMKSFIVLDSFIDDIPFGLFQQLTHAIDSFKDGSYYPQKQALVKRLPDTEHIAYELMIVVLSNYRRCAIQGLSIQLGKMLDYDDMIEACKIGSSLLAVCHGKLYDIELDDEGTFIVPKLCIDPESQRKCKALCYLPPVRDNAPAWKSNTGGWEWERKSVILGEGNHHELNQNLDVLNKVQEIAWCIDKDVLENEVNPNIEMDKSQFNEIVSDYIDEEFYFVWRYDKRGRMYSSGYDLNVQSNEYGKALLSPVNSEALTGPGVDAIAIAIAGHAGMDKLTWDERLKWFDSVEDDKIEWKEPILGRKADKIFDTCGLGREVNYFMQLDATSSFAQIMSCLSGCVTSAKLCNLVDTGKRENLYATVQEKVNSRLPVNKHVDNIKKITMVHYYNSVAKPKEMLDDEQLEVFYDVLSGLLPGCEEVMEVINDAWNPNALEHSWKLPDGHVCVVPVVEPEEIRIEVEELEGRRFTLRYNKNQPSRNFRSLCPNAIHSIDAYINREMVKRCDFELASIHKNNCGFVQ